MKGIELPINILVIVAVAIIVLLGIVALFYSTWFTGTSTIDLNAATNRACNAVRGNCGTSPNSILLSPNYKNSQGTISATLGALCFNEYNIGGSETLEEDYWTTCLNQVCGLNC